VKGLSSDWLLRFEEDFERGEKYARIDFPVTEVDFSALATRRFFAALDPLLVRRSVSDARRLFLLLPDPETSLWSEFNPFIFLWKRK
jgi:hypothetical protein